MVAAAFREKHRPIYPSAIACMERDWEACLRFYAFSEQHWKHIRTTTILERTSEKVKKRSKKMAATFRNERCCLLLFYAVMRTLRFRKLRMLG